VGRRGQSSRWTSALGRLRWRAVFGGVAGVGWRSAAHRGRGRVASRPHGSPGGGPGTTRPGWSGRSGRRPASGADDEPHTIPGPITAREDTATVAHGQGGALAGVDDPAGPADVQGLAGGPPRTGGSRAAAVWSRVANPPSRSWPPRASWSRGLPGSWSWVGGWRVIRTRVRAPSQASRRHAPGPTVRPSRPRHPGCRGRCGPGGCPDRPPPSAGAAPHPSGAAGRPPGCGGPVQ
jgi:hypothetical protein